MSKKIAEIKKILDGNRAENEASFVVLGRRNNEYQCDFECFVDGNWDIILPTVADELAHIIVNGSEDKEQIDYNADLVCKTLRDYCARKWIDKMREPDATFTLDGELTEEQKKALLGEDEEDE